ncbi:MAG: bifunctional phosphoglucose/phosphomannose isomerase [Candidatus Thorarchaeota archaeon]|jgi:glucose/mannose-6-phosphate isomerase
MSELGDLDRMDMRALVNGFPRMLRATQPSESLLETAKTVVEKGLQGICIIGMGGSAISGDLCRGIVSDVAKVPIIQVRGYNVPPVVDDKWVSVVVSYSGNTEETVAAFHVIRERRSDVFVVSSGGTLAKQARDLPIHRLASGIQPRAALPLIFSIILPLVETLQSLPRSDLKAASTKLEELTSDWTKAGLTPDEVARELTEVLPVFVGAEHLVPVAYRARCQINENSKRPAFHSELPEANHNEVEAFNLYRKWSVTPVFLHSEWYDSRITRRIEETSSILNDQGVEPLHLHSVGSSKLVEALAHVFRLDLVSVELARIAGVDPLEVPLITELKERIDRPSD